MIYEREDLQSKSKIEAKYVLYLKLFDCAAKEFLNHAQICNDPKSEGNHKHFAVIFNMFLSSRIYQRRIGVLKFKEMVTEGGTQR